MDHKQCFHYVNLAFASQKRQTLMDFGHWNCTLNYHISFPTWGAFKNISTYMYHMLYRRKFLPGKFLANQAFCSAWNFTRYVFVHAQRLGEVKFQDTFQLAMFSKFSFQNLYWVLKLVKPYHYQNFLLYGIISSPLG